MSNVLYNTGNKIVNSIRLGANDKNIYCYLSEKYKNMSIEEMNKIFQSKNAYAIYPLETPIERILTPEEMAMFKGLRMETSTTISNDENAEMELTYTVDTKSYIDKKIAEISTAIVKGI